VYLSPFYSNIDCKIMYCILLSIVRTFYMENDAEILSAHYTWKVGEKRFKMASMMNKLAMINSCEIVLKK
jgi:hypothetical protein